MRIAVFHNLPSGGAKRSLYEIMKRLSRDHSLDIYTLSSADHQFCDVRPFSRMHEIFPYHPSTLFHSPFGRLNHLQRWRDLLRLDRLARKISSVIDSQNYDVVLAQPCMWTQSPLLLRYLRAPTIYYCHEPPRHLYEHDGYATSGPRGWRAIIDRVDPIIHLYQRRARRYDWQATRSARRVLVNSQYMQAYVQRVYDCKPQVAYFGVDVALFRPQAEGERADYVLSVGAIHPHKGFDFLIESVAHIPSQKRPRLCLVGNAALAIECNRLTTLAQTRGVHLQIEVGVDEATLVARYAQAKLFLYAPCNEPFGFAALEAMACGTPVVGVKEGGVCETVVDGVTGRLVERDPAQFAYVIVSLLGDSALRDQYGRRAQEYVSEQWTWDSSVNRIETHLVEVAAGR